jgi:hypothetical protein
MPNPLIRKLENFTTLSDDDKLAWTRPPVRLGSIAPVRTSSARATVRKQSTC